MTDMTDLTSLAKDLKTASDSLKKGIQAMSEEFEAQKTASVNSDPVLAAKLGLLHQSNLNSFLGCLSNE